jgi:ATP-dependent Lon protease
MQSTRRCRVCLSFFLPISQTEAEEILLLAMQSRKRVKDQLASIDSAYPDVVSYFVGTDCAKRYVATVEEKEFPQFYHLKPTLAHQDQKEDETIELITPSASIAKVTNDAMKPQ